MAKASGLAMGALAAATPVAGPVEIDVVMRDLRGKLDANTYDAWLKAVAMGAEGVAAVSLGIAAQSGGTAMESGNGPVLAMSSVIAVSEVIIAANAQVVVAMAMGKMGTGARVDISSSGVIEGTGVATGRPVPERAAETRTKSPKAEAQTSRPAPKVTQSGRIRAEQLPTSGRIRFVPPKNWNPSNPAKGTGGGLVDKFGNEWVKGPSRTAGEAFEWDVQLSKTGKSQLGWVSPDGRHLNVSLSGKITH
jgi:hypothetical protein